MRHAFQAQVGIADSHIDYTDKSLTVIPFVDGTKMYFDTRKNAKTFVGLEGKDGKYIRARPYLS